MKVFSFSFSLPSHRIFGLSQSAQGFFPSSLQFGCDQSIIQDYHYNEAVCLRLAVLIAGRMEAERTLTTTYIATWDRSVKGIDDTALHDLPITSISVECWFNQLSLYFQRKVAVILNRE